MTPSSGSSSSSTGGVITSPPRKKRKTQISPAKAWVFTWHLTPKNSGVVQVVPEDPRLGMAYWIKVWKPKVSSLIATYEKGESGTTHHIQGFVRFKQKCRPVSHKFPLHTDGWLPINWEKAKGNDLQQVEYCSKENTPIISINMPEQVRDPWDDITQPYTWQQRVLDKIENPPEDRTIHWYWSDDGCTGKSTLAKHLVLKHDALMVGGKAADAKTAIAGMRVKPKIVIMDVPRCVEHISYTALEEIKNGLFFSSKYESQMVTFNKPHLFVFANIPPATDKLSQNRWGDVYEVNKEQG